MSRRTRRFVGLGLEICVPAAIVVAWGVWSANAHSFYFPPLTTILKTFRETWLFANVSSDLVPSLVRILAGFFAAVIVALLIGVPLGMVPAARRATSPIVEFLRAIPAPALLPFGIAVIGIGDGMKIFIIAFVCIWPVLLNTIDGIRAVDSTLADTVRMYGLPLHQRLLRVVLPAASPQIFAGMRTSLTLAILMMVISEMVASTSGIGYFILEAERTFAIPAMWSGIVLLGILGYVLNLAFVLIERRVLRWHRGARGGALT